MLGRALARAGAGGDRRGARAGRLPLLVGGTGLYLRALLDGLAPVPPVPAASCATRRGRSMRGSAARRFHAALAELDPEAAARLAARPTRSA